jgi:starch-binding outer membrane protein SusE/F
MKKLLIIYLTFIGFLCLLSNCKNDETKAVMLTDPIAPTFKTFPDLTLKRANASDTLLFVGTSVKPGFKASANYYLEVDSAGNNFQDPITIFSGIQDTVIKVSIGSINGTLIKRFPSDMASSLEFRIRAVFVQDGGTGVSSIVSISETKSVSVTTYGYPRLDVYVGTTLAGKIESSLADGSYIGYVKLDASSTFTLKDPDANIVFGDNSGALAVNGTAISSSTTAGYNQIKADTIAHSYSVSAFNVGILGSATSHGWNAPDDEMVYNATSGTWKVTLDLIVGAIKFRLNNDGNWAWNLGGTADNLTHGGDNIVISVAGNYTITLTITNPTTGFETGTCTMVQN